MPTTDLPELERKWWLPDGAPPDLLQPISSHLLQAYLVVDPGELRIRDDQTTQTMTGKSDGSIIRDEWNTTIPKWLFLQLLANTTLAIEKDRHDVWLDHHWELDLYRGQHAGLVIVELEWKIVDTSPEGVDSALEGLQAVHLDPRFGRGIEVTDDKRFKNKNLARYGVPT